MNKVSSKLLDLKGWESLATANPEASKDQVLEIAHLYNQTFSTDAGKVVLDLLVKATLVRPVVRPEDTQFQAGIREGRADIVRQILREIERAEG